MFEVILSPDASAHYADAERETARKLARCFAQLEHEPRRHNNIKRLSGELAGVFRYRIDDDARHVTVLVIAHRSEVYE